MAVLDKITDPFIWVKEDVIPPEICDEMIRRFEKYKDNHSQGRIGRGIDTDIKDSQDLLISSWLEWLDVSTALTIYTRDALPEYSEHCKKTTRKSFNTGEEIPLVIPMPKLHNTSHQIQKTPPGRGYVWHSDSHMGRILTYIYYLNDVEDGYTEFWQGDRVYPKKGKLLLFPADWTYYHQGYPPKQDKYISIGWASCLQTY